MTIELFDDEDPAVGMEANKIMELIAAMRPYPDDENPEQCEKVTLDRLAVMAYATSLSAMPLLVSFGYSRTDVISYMAHILDLVVKMLIDGEVGPAPDGKKDH